MTNTHANAKTLTIVYDNLSRIAEFCEEDVVLHPAGRNAPGTPAQVVGKQAVHDWEVNLIELSGGTLKMDVQTISANDYFGAVLGLLRVRRGEDEICMPFCGLWRFRDGRIIEHWENAYDAAVLEQFLKTGEVEPENTWLCAR